MYRENNTMRIFLNFLVLIQCYYGDKIIYNEIVRTHSTHGTRNAYRILVKKPGRKKVLGRTKCRWEENIKLVFKETRCEVVD
jgi:hypothetical protein